MQGTSGPIQCAMHITDGLLHLKPNLLEVWDKGCSELYQELGQYAELCHELFERKWSEQPVEAPGVYDYEVSCEFGDWFGKYILEHGGEAPLYCTCYRVLNELAEEFWRQAEEFTNKHKEV